MIRISSTTREGERTYSHTGPVWRPTCTGSHYSRHTVNTLRVTRRIVFLSYRLNHPRGEDQWPVRGRGGRKDRGPDTRDDEIYLSVKQHRVGGDTIRARDYGGGKTYICAQRSDVSILQCYVIPQSIITGRVWYILRVVLMRKRKIFQMCP